MGKEKKILYFDAHSHVQFPAYGKERETVIKRAEDLCVGVVAVGTMSNTSQEALSFALKYENIWASVGIHPLHSIDSFYDENELGKEKNLELSKAEIFNEEFFYNLVENDKVVAIGECGLDYFHISKNPEERDVQKNTQKREFINQINFAGKVKKPLMIHCRDAYPDLIDILDSKFKILNSPPGIVHFFSGTKDEAKKLIDLGFYFTFGGAITYPYKGKGINYSEIINFVPMNRILSETDAPYVAPAPYRGKRNEPAYVIEVVKKLAEVRDVPFEAMREQILENVKNVFGIKF